MESAERGNRRNRGFRTDATFLTKPGTRASAGVAGEIEEGLRNVWLRLVVVVVVRLRIAISSSIRRRRGVMAKLLSGLMEMLQAATSSFSNQSIV
jgi:hypothetical protein